MSDPIEKTSRTMNCTEKEMDAYFLGVGKFYNILFKPEGTAPAGKSYVQAKKDKWLQIAKDMQQVAPYNILRRPDELRKKWGVSTIYTDIY